MRNIITTAVLVLFLSSAYAGGGWNNQTRSNNPRQQVDIRRPGDNKYLQMPVTRMPQPVIVRQCQPPVYQQPVQCGPVAMCPADFYQLQQTINRASFESSKLTIFRQALNYNYFTSQQVLQLMDQFCFESYKVDVAQMAYTKTVDPGNYYIVNNGFTFSSSVRQLDDYIAMR